MSADAPAPAGKSKSKAKPRLGAVGVATLPYEARRLSHSPGIAVTNTAARAQAARQGPRQEDENEADLVIVAVAPGKGADVQAHLERELGAKIAPHPSAGV